VNLDSETYGREKKLGNGEIKDPSFGLKKLRSNWEFGPQNWLNKELP